METKWKLFGELDELWIATEDTTELYGHGIARVGCFDTETPDYDEAQRNAEFLLQATKCHDKLVDALRWALSILPEPVTDRERADTAKAHTVLAQADPAAGREPEGQVRLAGKE